MQRISGVSLRRVLALPAVLTLVLLAGCGDEPADGGEAAQPQESASSSGADGECGGGEVDTQVVEAAEGVRLTTPAEWQVETAARGAQVGLYPVDPDAGDGFVVVEETGQTLDEAVEDALAITADSAEQTSEQDLELDGFDAARLLTFAYDDSDSTFSVNVVAVTDDGLRVVANMTREVAEEQPLVESCLSSLSRTS